jgi:hypothetical protein
VKGSFRPNNPYGAMTTTTVVFPTTMGNPSPPIATGEPTTPTTTFSGRYDFLREGSIMITPGANRFGGTMKFFNGPNQMYYLLHTLSTPYITKAYGAGTGPTTSIVHPDYLGLRRVGRLLSAVRMTPSGYYPLTTGTPNSPGDTYILNLQYITTAAPWTTGMVIVATHSPHTWMHFVYRSGYDNRTPNGLSGVISLVRPRLVHSYVVPHDPNLPIVKARSFAQIWQMKIHFLPEPSGVAMLAAGFATLAGLYRLRRR